ncbi:Lrp/AsnC family transcriptional regulator [Candidatus Bathyarchaeota archaeon]|nr:Lrp/AsnC family transcriptional regulator [Candidatus Bathyarchaeota archaeon]
MSQATHVTDLIIEINIYPLGSKLLDRCQLIEELDELDRKLLHELQRNARRSFRELAGKVGASVATVINRVRALEERGIILGYSAIIDLKRLGYETAVIELVVSKGRLLDVEREVAKNPMVHQVYDVTGETDAIIICKFKSRGELSQFVKSLLAMPNVERTVTHLVLTTVKEDSRILRGSPD